MRLFISILTIVIVSVNVECQRRFQTGSGNPSNTNTRLGLVSSQLGVSPVPGGQPGNFIPPTQPQASGCFCIPSNQLCPNQPLPASAAAIGNFNLRIVNTRPQNGVCTQANTKICCFNGREEPNPVIVNPGFPNPNPINPIPIVRPPVRPNPVIPNPVPFGTCGVSNSLRQTNPLTAEARFGEFPWMAVVLDLQDRYLGGGVLVSSNYVLTAAHKIYQSTQAGMKVRLGEHDVKSPQDHPQYPHLEVRANNVIIHPQFNAQSLANDVALIRLSQPVNTNNYPHIATACLPEYRQIFDGQNCWVSGWGKDAFEQQGRFQHTLKKVDVPIVEAFSCEQRLKQSRLGDAFTLDRKSFVCAGGVAGKDACTGDGGAPLVCPNNRGGFTVAGLVAWGIGCAQGRLPGVYVNVANYMDFVRQYVRV